MRLVATSIVASEVFFLKLKHFILTGIAGGLIALKLQKKRRCERSAAISLLLVLALLAVLVGNAAGSLAC